MWYRRLIPYVILVSCFFSSPYRTWAQSVAASPTAATPQELPGPLQAATVVTRKNEVQTRLEALGKSNLPKEDLEATRTTLEQLLKVLTDLEESLQRRQTLSAYLDGLPQRLRDLETERKSLENRPTPPLPKVTAELQGEYEGRLQNLQNELQELTKQMAVGEVRAAAIAKELEQRTTEQAQLEKELLAARSEAAKTGEQTLQALRVELLDWRVKLQQVETEALTVERDWLAKRGPVQDAMQSIIQMRLKQVAQDVERIKQELHTALVAQQATLSSQATHLEQQLEQTADPTAALRLAVTLETIEIRKQTAEYQQQRTQLGQALRTQEKRNAQAKNDADRLLSLVGKHASGEGVAQRLWRAFERLQRERARYSSAALKDFDTRLRLVAAQTLTLDDRLYDFDNAAETRLASLQADLQKVLRLPGELMQQRQEAAVSEGMAALEEQKIALREQQQAITALEQDLLKIVTLQRDYKRLLDESYLFVLSKMFWLRDADALTWDSGMEIVTGLLAMRNPVETFLILEQTHLYTALRHQTSAWLLLALTFLGLTWVVYITGRSLCRMTTGRLVWTQARAAIPSLWLAFVILLSTAIWPAYLLFLSWLRTWWLPPNLDYADVSAALSSALQTSALIFWIASVCWHLFQPQGWGQQFWGLSNDLRTLLRTTLISGCVAALVLLVPHRFLLSVSSDAALSAGSVTLARCLFLAFQCVILVLLSILGRRYSAFMTTALADSRQRHGLLWRIWPLLYILLLSSIVLIMVVDTLGYRYAARFVWRRSIESLGVLVGIRLLIVPLGMQLLRWWHFLMPGPPEPPLQPMLRRLCQGSVWLLTSGIILELWGVSVFWLFSSPTGADVLSRVLTVLLTLGGMVMVITLGKTLTEYMLQPRLTRAGVTYESGRKLKTLLPLLQAIVRILAVFVVVVVFLEQIGVDTSPLLTGVGFLGLAVGFAAQSLIKDVINGLFLLFEDSVSVGDIVTLRGIGGQVEKVTLRAVTLRDLEGKVHVIPNGTIDTVTNMTKDYAYSVLDVGIAYDTDVDTVLVLLRHVDEAIREDPDYASDILEPLDIMGLEHFGESAMIIRARIKTRPMQQWRIGREFKRQIKKTFDEHGIEIPFPQRVLHWRSPKEARTTPTPGETPPA